MILFRTIKLTLTAILLISQVGALASEDRSCDNPKMYQAATQLLLHFRAYNEAAAVPQFANAQVGNIGQDCSPFWLSAALYGTEDRETYEPLCGVVLNFSTQEDFRAFARASGLFNPGSVLRVSANDTTPDPIPTSPHKRRRMSPDPHDPVDYDEFGPTPSSAPPSGRAVGYCGKLSN